MFKEPVLEDVLSSIRIHLPINFSQEQKMVIAHVIGHALASSVAGSGKSTVLIYRILNLLEHGFTAREILVLMYNKLARDQFEEGLKEAGGDLIVPRIWTFHGFGQSMLFRLYDLLGKERPVIEDDEKFWVDLLLDVADQVNKARDDEDLSPLVVYRDRAPNILGAINLLKNFGYPHLTVPDNILQDDSIKVALALFDLFEDKRRSANIVALDDLLYDAFEVSFSHPTMVDEYLFALRPKQIIVDEYQDSNAIQQWLLKRLAGPETSVMAVGDDDQSIYGWRGADPTYMLYRFKLDFPGTTTYTMTKTYRYGHAISMMANHLLRENLTRTQKSCFSMEKHISNVFVYQGDREDILLEQVLDNLPPEDWHDTTILVRNYDQLNSVELELLRRGLPVNISREKMFVRRKEGRMIRDLLAFVENNEMHPEMDSVVALLKFIYPRAFHDWCREVSRLLNAEGWKVGIDKAFKTLGKHNDALSATLAVAYRMIEKLSHLYPDAPVEDVVTPWLDSHDTVNKRGEPSQIPEDSFWVLASCLSGMTITEARTWLDTREPSEHGVLLTSIHKSKGGGWKHVIIPGLKEGIFPSFDQSQLEEERRLFYVASTRAKETLHLLVPIDDGFSAREKDIRHDDIWKSRLKDKTNPLIASRFLYESCPSLCQTAQNAMMNGNPSHHSVVIQDYAKTVFPKNEDALSSLLKGLF